MENLPFVIWVLLYPFLWGIYTLISFKVGYHQTFSDEVHVISAVFDLVIWVVVGALLYH
jgi:hypothetical protein